MPITHLVGPTLYPFQGSSVLTQGHRPQSSAPPDTVVYLDGLLMFQTLLYTYAVLSALSSYACRAYTLHHEKSAS